ncbi:MAG: site-specific DNA-methyltransferase, partial [Gammaproteobacteria bacterium]
NMMYPRLYLAKNLLRDDGLIFISIDETEIHNLRAICNDIFGEECFVGCISRVTGTPTGGGNKALVGEIDYILVYSRLPDVRIEGINFSKEDARIYDKEDERGKYLTRPLRRTGGEDRREDRPSMFYPITAPDGTKIFPIAPAGYESRWICGIERFKEMERDGLIEWMKIKKNGTEKWQVYQKFYLEGRVKQPSNFWAKLEGNKKATRDLRALFDGEKVFSFPKPVGLIQQIIQISDLREGDIVLDFFAGSGTTAHALMKQNSEDGVRRKYILVQLPEPLDPNDKEQTIGAKFCDKLGVPRNIAELTKERLRRAAKQVMNNSLEYHGDFGFRTFKLYRSNFKVWDGNLADADEQTLQRQLERHVEHVSEESSQEDILYELLLKAGFPLTTKVEAIEMAGKQVFSIEHGAMLICLEDEVTPELIDAMAEADPLQVICLDRAFAGNDQLKANAVQTFKVRASSKESEIVFMTV